jgi:hypothetical protein
VTARDVTALVLPLFNEEMPPRAPDGYKVYKPLHNSALQLYLYVIGWQRSRRDVIKALCSHLFSSLKLLMLQPSPRAQSV